MDPSDLSQTINMQAQLSTQHKVEQQVDLVEVSTMGVSGLETMEDIQGLSTVETTVGIPTDQEADLEMEEMDFLKAHQAHMPDQVAGQVEQEEEEDPLPQEVVRLASRIIRTLAWGVLIIGTLTGRRLKT